MSSHLGPRPLRSVRCSVLPACTASDQWVRGEPWSAAAVSKSCPVPRGSVPLGGQLTEERKSERLVWQEMPNVYKLGFQPA